MTEKTQSDSPRCDARETLASRIGFLMLSVGCAIGLGNVWRFPYICGKYGGGFFVLLYLLFLVLLGFPILLMELAVGRSSRLSLPGGLARLARKSKGAWRNMGRVMMCGNVVLMMFYTTIAGWMLAYAGYFFSGRTMAEDGSAEAYGNMFANLVGSWRMGVACMLIVVAFSTLMCSVSLQKTVERVVKYLMFLLFALIVFMVVKALTLDNALAGVRFYLLPNWHNFAVNPAETIFAAMGQAFFTLSIGVGAMEIFGSYLKHDSHSLVAETVSIIVLDTMCALGAGLIIFPACLSFGVNPGEGPGLVFVSLPHVFKQMQGGWLFGAMFFLFMSIAALTTVIAVFENIISFIMDEFRIKRWCAALLVGVGIAILSLPCVFGGNIWKGVEPFGKGSCILDLEDFIVSMNLLPLGGLALSIFCSWSVGWGMKGMAEEVSPESGAGYPRWCEFYCKYILPTLILVVFVVGYYQFVQKWKS